MTYLDACNEFIHQAQKERGTVSVYLRGKDTLFADEIETQFSEVDECTKNLSLLPRGISPKIAPLLNSVSFIPSKRKYIISKMIDAPEALGFYTREIIAPALDVISELAILDSANQPAKVSALAHFLQWKERIGLERALGAQLIACEQVNKPEFTGQLEYLITEQQAYERMFLALADPEQRQALEAIKAQNPIFEKIDAINAAIAGGTLPNHLQTLTAQDWFALFSAKMDMLHVVSRQLIAGLQNQDERPLSSQKTTPVPPSLQEHRETIEALPLFRGLSSATREELLRHARLVRHGKGAIIFLQGEQALRFYLIIEGWVKIFKDNADGDESVLHMVGAGDCLLESVIFSKTAYPASAQTVEQVTLLSIPAAMIREKLKNHPDLAMNMMSAIASKSQQLITQFEQLTLKSTTQRVGWFLLKLLLEQGETRDILKLPYDKALIAGSLGMKPETFSRTLQQLKEQGIDIDKNIVKLPDIFALCDYCDLELAAMCSRHGEAKCPNPDCAKCA